MNHWMPAVQRVGLDGLRVHDLRHTAVGFAINLSRAQPKAVQVRFGHSSIQVTFDRYGHLFPQMDADIADDLDAAYRAARSVRRETPAATPLSPLATRRRTRIGHAGHEKDTKSVSLAVTSGA